MQNADSYFINEWTMTKAGRKKMREFLNKLPTIETIKPSKDFINDWNTLEEIFETKEVRSGMRRPYPYELYLLEVMDRYQGKDREAVNRIFESLDYFHKLLDIQKDLLFKCYDTTISKATMKWLSELDSVVVPEYLPEELQLCAKEFYAGLNEMYANLVDNKDIYFMNEWTLSKAGRETMNKSLLQLPLDPMIPSEHSMNNSPK